MATIRFPISEDTNKKLMSIKGGKLKQNYAEELFKKAVDSEYKKKNKK
jgi:hypothetical protein